MKAANRKLRTIVLTSVSVLLWSTLATLGQKLNAVPPFLLLGLSLGIGSLLSLPRCKSWFAFPAILAFGTAGIFGYHFLLFMALRLAPPVEANLLNYLWPVGIVLLTPVFFPDRRLKLRHLIGAGLAFVGAALVIARGSLEFHSANALGFLFATLAAAAWSFYSVLTKRIGGFPTSAVGGFCFCSALLALAAHAALEPKAVLTSAQWIWILMLGVGPLGIAFFSWDAALKDGDPRMIAALSYFTPLLSTLFLSLSTRTVLGPRLILAAALILAGAILSSLSGFEQEAVKEHAVTSRASGP